MNEYYNPLIESFKLAKKLDRISFWLMIISALLTVLNYISNIYFVNHKDLAVDLSTINTVLIIIYVIVKFAINYIIFQTSIDKRADFIDNSFGTNYSSNKSNQYYTNETIENGILRMGVNGFESCYFTYNLSVKSLQSKWIINIIVTVIIIGLALQGYNSVLSMILQLSLPLYLISDAINNSIFCLRMKSILDSFCRLYNDLLDVSQAQKKEPEIILVILNYETTLSTFNLLISEDVYIKYNPELSSKWDGLKQQYNLK